MPRSALLQLREISTTVSTPRPSMPPAPPPSPSPRRDPRIEPHSPSGARVGRGSRTPFRRGAPTEAGGPGQSRSPGSLQSYVDGWGNGIPSRILFDDEDNEERSQQLRNGDGDPTVYRHGLQEHQRLGQLGLLHPALAPSRSGHGDDRRRIVGRNQRQLSGISRVASPSDSVIIPNRVPCP